MTTSAQELAELAIQRAQQQVSEGTDVREQYVEFHVEFAEAADGRRQLLQEAYDICLRRFEEGEPAAGVAAKLLDEVQSSNLVE